jgi:hypothetical protein
MEEWMYLGNVHLSTKSFFHHLSTKSLIVSYSSRLLLFAMASLWIAVFFLSTVRGNIHPLENALHNFVEQTGSLKTPGRYNL